MLCNIEQNILNIHTLFKMSCPQTRRCNTANMSICYCKFFSGLISMFVFDILQNTRGCIQICSGYNAVICNPLAMGLVPSYCDWAFHGFTQSLHAAPGIVSSYKQWLPVSKCSFTKHHPYAPHSKLCNF
jgi:hypothetical protein